MGLMGQEDAAAQQQTRMAALCTVAVVAYWQFDNLLLGMKHPSTPTI
jgi:hypothetical protein